MFPFSRMGSDACCYSSNSNLTVSLAHWWIFLGVTKMAEGERELVKFEAIDGIGIITIDNPPVNALSPGVPDGITAAVERGNADPSVKAMVLIGAGRSFIAGADIRQFGTGSPRPTNARRHYDVTDD